MAARNVSSSMVSAGVFHGTEQRGLGVPRRRSGLLREPLEGAVESLSFDERRQRGRRLVVDLGAAADCGWPVAGAPARRAAPRAPSSRRASPICATSCQPATRRTRPRAVNRSGGAGTSVNSRSSLAASLVASPPADPGAPALPWRPPGADADHGLGQGELGVGEEDAQEPAHDQIEHPPLVGRERLEPDALAGGDDGVVVTDLGVVEDALRARGRSGGEQRLGERRVVRQLREPPEQLGHLVGEVARQVARVGARIREHLVPLVQRLRGLERARRAQAVTPVGGALQRREIEELRRRLARLPARGGARPAGPAGRSRRRGGPLAPRSRRPAPRLPAATPSPCPWEQAWTRRRETTSGRPRRGRRHPPRVERAAHLPVVLRPERRDGALAVDHQRQRGRLDAADGIHRRAAAARRPTRPRRVSWRPPRFGPRDRRRAPAGAPVGCSNRRMTVTARVAFIPTSQSASERQRAASPSAS